MRLSVLLLCASVLLVAFRSAEPRTLSGYGIRGAVPEGWHGRVLRGALEASTVELPGGRTSIAPALSRRLGRGDLGLLLFENGPSWSLPFDRNVYRLGYPRPFSQRDFRPPPLGGSNPGKHAFARRNFTVAGRSFDLFVESGSLRPSTLAVAGLNELVRSLKVRQGDFYPGKAPPARFPRSNGWFTTHSGTVPVGPSTYSVSIASTVRYRDQPTQFPPHETLAQLPPDGVVIWLGLSADNRDPPTAAEPRRLLIDTSRCGSFEGLPDLPTCAIHAQRPREYDLDGWVIFGRLLPTAAQRARAQEELNRLVLPTWPRWPVGS